MSTDVEKRAREYAYVLEDLFHDEGWDASAITSASNGEYMLFVAPSNPTVEEYEAVPPQHRTDYFGNARVYIKCDPRGAQHDTLKVHGAGRARAARVLDKRLGGRGFHDEENVLIRKGRR